MVSTAAFASAVALAGAMLCLAGTFSLTWSQVRRSEIDVAHSITNVEADLARRRFSELARVIVDDATSLAKTLGPKICAPSHGTTDVVRLLLLGLGNSGYDLARLIVSGASALGAISPHQGHPDEFIMDHIFNTSAGYPLWRREAFNTTAMTTVPISTTLNRTSRLPRMMVNISSFVAPTWFSHVGVDRTATVLDNGLPEIGAALTYAFPMDNVDGRHCVLALEIAQETIAALLLGGSKQMRHAVVASTNDGAEALVVATSGQSEAPQGTTLRELEWGFTLADVRSTHPRAVDELGDAVPVVVSSLSEAFGISWHLVTVSSLPDTHVCALSVPFIASLCASLACVAVGVYLVCDVASKHLLPPVTAVEETLERGRDSCFLHIQLWERWAARLVYLRLLRELSIVKSLVQPGILRVLRKTADPAFVGSAKRMMTFVYISFRSHCLDTTLRTARTVIPLVTAHLSQHDMECMVEAFGAEWILLAFDGEVGHADAACEAALELVALITDSVRERTTVLAIIDSQETQWANFAGKRGDAFSRHLTRAPVTPATHFVELVERLVESRLKEPCCATQRTVALLENKQLLCRAIDCVQLLPYVGIVEPVVLYALYHQRGDGGGCSPTVIKRSNDTFQQLLAGHYARALGQLRRHDDAADVHAVRWQRMCEERLSTGDMTPYVRREVDPWAA